MKPFQDYAMHKNQRGFSLVELMIAMTIGLAITAAIGYMFQTSKTAFNTSQGMARVQDNARTAQLLLNSIVRQAGYIDDVIDNSDPAAVFTSPAYSIRGGSPSGLQSTITWVAANPSYKNTATDESGTQLLNRDFLEVAFNGDSNNDMVNCLGTVITAAQLSINVFYVDQITANHDTVPSLYCETETVTLGATGTVVKNSYGKQPLIAGITGLQVTYGYDSDANGTIDSYVPASLISSANWVNVKSMTIRLTAMSNNKANPSSNSTSVTYTNAANTQTMQNGYLTRPIISTLQVRNRLVKL